MFGSRMRSKLFLAAALALASSSAALAVQEEAFHPETLFGNYRGRVMPAPGKELPSGSLQDARLFMTPLSRAGRSGNQMPGRFLGLLLLERSGAPVEAFPIQFDRVDGEVRYAASLMTVGTDGVLGTEVTSATRLASLSVAVERGKSVLYLNGMLPDDMSVRFDVRTRDNWEWTGSPRPGSYEARDAQGARAGEAMSVTTTSDAEEFTTVLRLPAPRNGDFLASEAGPGIFGLFKAPLTAEGRKVDKSPAEVVFVLQKDREEILLMATAGSSGPVTSFFLKR